jgi:uncharacterized alpha-E superfamily protein
LRGVFPAEPGRTVDDWLDGKADALVGQELVTLSTTPAFENGKLVPRPMSLRIFLARTPAGWTVMPGGFARIGNSADATAIAMRDGGSSADVWIVSEAPVPLDTMLPGSGKPHTRRQPAVLPSRSAENLFWLGRYIERAEGLMRIVRSYNARLAEAPDPASPLLDSLREHLAGYSVDAAEGLPEGLQQAIAAAVNSASKIRYRFAIDGWAALSDLADTVARMRATVQPGEDSADAMGVLLRKIAGFSGLVHENMYRFTGWRFMTIGRSIERAATMAYIMARFTGRDAPDGSYDLALELGDSIMSHRRRYSVTTTRDSVIDMLVLDIQNPRSILYHLSQIREQVEELPNARVEGQLSDLARDVVRLETSLSIKRPADMDSDGLLAIASDIAGLYTQLAASYLK